jgi:hypothetical protein
LPERNPGELPRPIQLPFEARIAMVRKPTAKL